MLSLNISNVSQLLLTGAIIT